LRAAFRCSQEDGQSIVFSRSVPQHTAQISPLTPGQ
jgi:hypothetical protein